MIYRDSDGVWLMCSCTKKRVFLHANPNVTLTMMELKELIRVHGHH